jgi:hypothetical protein
MPLPPEHDKAFKRLQTDILKGYEQIKAGPNISTDEMRSISGITKKTNEIERMAREMRSHLAPADEGYIVEPDKPIKGDAVMYDNLDSSEIRNDA